MRGAGLTLLLLFLLIAAIVFPPLFLVLGGLGIGLGLVLIFGAHLLRRSSDD